MNILARLKRRAVFELKDILVRLRNTFCSSYECVPHVMRKQSPRLNTYLSSLPVVSLQVEHVTILSLAELHRQHRFNLLGSKWLEASYSNQALGFDEHIYHHQIHFDFMDSSWLASLVTKKNLIYAKEIWSLIKELAPSYQPIDWHRDHKSGYRWPGKAHHSKIKVDTNLRGVDIKFPRELARMQHLPIFAYAYALTEDKLLKNSYLVEFQCQILDFIMTNPPNFGVNWQCTMDIAIRISNCLIAYDLFVNFGAEFNKKFNQLFFASIYAHGKHIINNLEWYFEAVPRGNHYLANIAGLLFVSAYLPETEETNTWLAFSVDQIIKESKQQFYPDGSNVEGSTCYHRLSSEMLVYSAALILGLNDSRHTGIQRVCLDRRPFKDKVAKKQITFYENVFAYPDKKSLLPLAFFNFLERITKFTIAVTKQNGNVVQIGDNDSGRFFKLQPLFVELTERKANKTGMSQKIIDEENLVENPLNHKHLVSASSGLLINNFFFNLAEKEKYFENTIVRNLSNNFCCDLTIGCNSESKNFDPVDSDQSYLALPSMDIKTYSFNCSIDTGALELSCYPDFGLYILKNKKCFISLRCGPINHSHAHWDLLSLEVLVDGCPIFSDQGSYIYTASPNLRSLYRHASAHNGPYLKSATELFSKLGVFDPYPDIKTSCLEMSKNKLHCQYEYDFCTIHRIVEVYNSAIKVIDFVERNNGKNNSAFISSLGEVEFTKITPSIGYGCLLEDRDSVF